MATLKCCCKECEKRHPGCHGHCEDYKEFRERCDEVNRNRTGSILADPLISTMVRKRAWRRIHRRGGKIHG